MKSWYRTKPWLFTKKSGTYYIKLDLLAKCPGIDLIDAFCLPGRRWFKAVDLAAAAGISRKTVGNWCRDRPRFAKRIGRIWYVDMESLGATEDQIDALEKWAPDRTTAIAFLRAVGDMGQSLPEEG